MSVCSESLVWVCSADLSGVQAHFVLIVPHMPSEPQCLSCYMFSGWGGCGMLALESAAENMGRVKYIWSSPRRNEWKQEKQQNVVNSVNSFVNLMLSYLLWNDTAFCLWIVHVCAL